ncbi:MAG: superoxide dismutase [Rickettsiales bacterium]
MNEACSLANQKSFPFILPELPYADTALEPHMSAKTFSFHHKKHHNAYVVNLNKLLENNNDLNTKSLEEIIMLTHNDPSKIGVFNNAGQVWNHSFFWHCMKSNGGGNPSGAIAKKIEEDFGSYDNFISEFKNAAATQFGSGWAWLVLEESGKLSIMKTANAELPMTQGKKALLTIDVWEHAYYLDFQNLRPNYVETFLNHLVNWDFVNQMLNHS